MAIQWGRAHENPVKRIQMFREDNGRTRFLTDEEEVRLLSECDAHLRPVVIAAIHTGFWKSELLFLTWGNVDFQHQLITVEAGYAKNGAARSIPMTSRLTDTLKPIRIHGDSNQRVSEQRGETLPRPPQLRSTRQSSGRGSRFLHFMTCVIRLPLASSRVALT
jgi:integrase